MKRIQRGLLVGIFIIIVGAILYFMTKDSGHDKVVDLVQDELVDSSDVENDGVIDVVAPVEVDKIHSDVGENPNKNDKSEDITSEGLGINQEITELFPAQKRVGDTLKYGYINTMGEFVIEPKYDMASDFVGPVAVVSMGEIYQIITENEEILVSDAHWLGNISNDRILYMDQVDGEYLYGYLTTKGDRITKPIFKQASNYSDNGTAVVITKDDSYGILNKEGELIRHLEVDESYGDDINIIDDYIIYHDDSTDKYGVNLLSGDILFEPIYSKITYLNEGMFALCSPKLYTNDVYETTPVALFNKEKEQLTDYILYDIQPYSQGYTTVTDSTTTYFVDTLGKKVEGLPAFEGRGKAQIFGKYIKVEIDGDLFYTMLDGKVIYKLDKLQQLTDIILVAEGKFKPNKYVTIRYPQITGLGKIEESVNVKLKELFTIYRESFKEEDRIIAEVNYKSAVKNNILIIKMSGYDYSIGATHGMPFIEYYYIDLSSGQFYQLKDLFIEDSNYKDVINEEIRKQIDERMEKEDTAYFSDGFIEIGEEQDFVIKKKGISIYFYPYEIAEYKEGFPSFLISNELLDEFYNKNGDFYKSLYQ